MRRDAPSRDYPATRHGRGVVTTRREERDVTSMIPSSEQIEQWANMDLVDDGWVKIPFSSWPELLWCLRQAEKVESELAALRRLEEVARHFVMHPRDDLSFDALVDALPTKEPVDA